MRNHQMMSMRLMNFYLINGLGSNILDELPRIDVELVESYLKQLKLGKSADADIIVAELIVH